jgi:hypothetical protein
MGPYELYVMIHDFLMPRTVRWTLVALDEKSKNSSLAVEAARRLLEIPGAVEVEEQYLRE